jgi:hypothetical protein
MRKSDEYKWPPKSEILFTNGRGKELFKTNDREYDLSDNLMGYWPRASRTIYMNLKSKSIKWESWSVSNLKFIENLIKYDLNFDAYQVSITKKSVVGGKCTEYFCWKLKITN